MIILLNIYKLNRKTTKKFNIKPRDKEVIINYKTKDNKDKK